MTGMEPRQFVEVLLEGSGCQPGDYQMGQDMVFFKGSKGAVLQELMLTPKEELAGKILASLKQTDPKHASIPQLEQYIAQRLEERKAAKEKLINAFFALHAMFGWNEAYKQIKLEKKAAATRMQAAQRGKLARKEIEEMKATGKEMEIRDLNVDEAPADVEFHIEAGLAKKSAGQAELDEEAQEAAEHEAKWFVTEPRTGRRYHRFLMCKGVEWGFQYHNFYGDWEMDDEEPLCNDRPHYKHNTMYGGYAHLFHCMDPHRSWRRAPPPTLSEGAASSVSQPAVLKGPGRSSPTTRSLAPAARLRLLPRSRPSSGRPRQALPRAAMGDWAGARQRERLGLLRERRGHAVGPRVDKGRPPCRGPRPVACLPGPSEGPGRTPIAWAAWRLAAAPAARLRPPQR